MTPIASLGEGRATSEILGLVFAFALVISVIATAQLAMTPVLTAGDEADHQHRVTSDLAELDAALFTAAGTDASGRVAVETDVVYPERYLIVSPPQATGTFDTTVSGTVTVSNATALGSSKVYWDGSKRPFTTKALVYHPNYAERNTETLYVESGVSYLRTNDGTEVVHRQSLVRGNDITLVLIDGELEGQTVAGQTVGFTPVTASERTLMVQSTTDERLTIEVPTTLSNVTWTRLLLDDENSTVYSVNVTQEPGNDYNTLTVVLEPGLYDLHIAQVSVGTPPAGEGVGVMGAGPGVPVDPDDANASVAYLVLESANGTWVPTGGSEKFVVRALDEYGSPVAGATLNATDGTFGAVTASNGAVTNEDGVVTFRYTPDGDKMDKDATLADDTVSISIGMGASKKEVLVEFEIRRFG
ncbi:MULTISPECIES: hypothetical protein [Haloferax]|uniref:Big-1 domain-containing protein n=1 Tax=Haloferax marinum TaxID=2666143 RepID=A0A6A8G8V0_9EURY|nr:MULTISPECIES: hypothetical protein [Haloferax]KAB1198403.1 hypothetical protein Hfx1150_13120 [Haloferax sp. CBA1150]MRW97504.1 hypothetical protein [Haloferax marinum]